MKVFVLLKENREVFAISEEEQDILQYIESRKLSETEFDYIVLKDESAERICMDFEDLYLEHDDTMDIIMTRAELRIVRDIFDEERVRIKTAMDELEHIISHYKLGKKSRLRLLKAHSTLSSLAKPKKLKKAIQLDDFIEFMRRSKNLMESVRHKVSQAAGRLYVFINNK